MNRLKTIDQQYLDLFECLFSPLKTNNSVQRRTRSKGMAVLEQAEILGLRLHQTEKLWQTDRQTDRLKDRHIQMNKQTNKQTDTKIVYWNKLRPK